MTEVIEKKNGWIIRKEISLRDIIQLILILVAIFIFFFQQDMKIDMLSARFDDHLRMSGIHNTVTENERFFVRSELYSRDLTEIKNSLREIKLTLEKLEGARSSK